jgi:chaperonin GroES
MNMNLKPLYDRIIVKPIKTELTDGGIIIPEIARRGTVLGEIIAVGEGVRGENGEIYPLRIKVGDKIRYQEHSGIELDGGELLVMRESDIIGIIE